MIVKNKIFQVRDLLRYKNTVIIDPKSQAC